MLRQAAWVIATLFCLPLAAYPQVPDIANIPMTVVSEKTDFTLHFTKGAVAAVGGGEDFNGFTGVSADMGGGMLGTVIWLTQNVPTDKAATLASFQGRLEGTVKCKRVRRGDSPNAPTLHVLAEGCSIVSINH